MPERSASGAGESKGGSGAEGIFQSRYREVTVSSIVFGVLVGGVMNAAITYAGLKIGFTIVGSAIAAVLGFGVLRGVLRRIQRNAGSILETNIGQTIASAVNTTNAGIIFTVPVLMLLAAEKGEENPLTFGSVDFWMITLACVAGAALGCVFIVPLRKQMIEIERLRFPSAVAVGAILKSPGAGAAKSVVLAAGILVGALVYAPAGLPGIRVAAGAEELDGLVERERITPAQAAMTREIASWIEAGGAPEPVVERGRLLVELRELREQDPAPERRIGELDAAQKGVAGAERYPASLAAAAYEATQGQREWSSLRATEFGWAGKPLPGYQDIGWRVGWKGASETVDRNDDGRADLVLTDDRLDVGRLLGLPDEVQLVFAIAPFALGAGYLTGRAGLMVLAGGILAYLVINPLAYRTGWMPESTQAFEAAQYGLNAFNRPLGIGLLLGGALTGVLAAMPAIREGLRAMVAAGRTRTAGGADEMGFGLLAAIAGVAMVLLLVALEFGGAGGAADVEGWLKWLSPWAARAVIALVGAAWIWFAGIIISQCTGMTDWSPISGLALLTVVLVMMLAGKQDVVSAVTLGAALCVAIGCASDMMADLKTGHIVGAQPRRQQVVEIATAVIGPLITMATLVLIASVNTQQVGLPLGPGTPTVAPQAQALKAVIEGVQGEQMPYALYGFGAALGALLGIGLFPGLGVLVGLSMYLPIYYILTYGLGCLANMAVGAVKGRRWAEEWGVPFCAGLVVGEAVLALVINSVVLVRG